MIKGSRKASDLVLERYMVAVHGPRGTGKTFLAATASSCFKKKGELKDMLWLGFDMGATDGFPEYGINVDCLDAKLIQADADLWKECGFKQAPSITQVADYMVNEAGKACSSGEKEIVVVDTVSSMNMDAMDHFIKLSANTNNKYAKFDYLLTFNRSFFTGLTRYCKKVILLFHSKVLNEDASDAQKRQSLATRCPGMPDIVPNIPGQGANIYIDNASIEIWLTSEPVVGKKGSFTRKAYLYSGKGAETKNRFQKALGEFEEPDLGLMFDKIQKAAKGKS